MMYWVITEASDDSECQHRWIAYPATEETLDDVINIAELIDKPVFIAKEMRHDSKIVQ